MRVARLVLLLAAGCYDPTLQTGDGGGGDARPCQPAIEQVAAGGRHTCVLDEEGSVFCAGANDYGQLGTGDTVDQATLTKVSLGPARTIAAAMDTTCAILADDSVACWGRNDFGQTGNRSQADQWSPAQVAGLADVASLSTGGEHTCAIAGEEIFCWGHNDHGQVGKDPALGFEVLEPATVPLEPTASAIALGGAHSCALLMGGVLYCWGQDEHGQLGRGNGSGSTFTPALVELSGVTAVAAGSDHTCAIDDRGDVHCWGDNSVGQPAGGGLEEVAPVPAGVSGASDLDLGEDFSCAVADARVTCWGVALYGQLGDGRVAPSGPPSQGVGDVKSVSAGDRHACAVSAAEGLVHCWGDGTQGQLADGEPTRRPDPAPGPGGVEGLAGGTHHACGVSEGRLACVGLNVFGQAAPPPTPLVVEPRAPVFPADVVRVVAGDAHSCALLADGTVWCWGRDDFGQIGDGPQVIEGVPQVALTPPGVDDLVAGEDHSCALMDGAVYCWGRCDNEQCGLDLGEGEGVHMPNLIPVVTNATSLGSGADHTCAVVASGAVRCWGKGDQGQLGDNSSVDRRNPVAAGTLADVTKVVGGAGHTCALRSGGSLWCWGANDFGQLGLDPAAVGGHTVPTASGFSGLVDVAAGHHVTCAVISDGRVECAGRGDRGALGPASFGRTGAPLTVLDGDVTFVAAGAHHLCTWGAAEPRCWGEDAHGQLFSGVTPSFAPRAIRCP